MNPLVRSLAGLGLGAATLGAGAVAALASRRHALAPESGETYDPAPCVEHRIVSDDGVPLHVEVSEPENTDWQSRPTIVLCHGYTLSTHSWLFVRRRLAAAGYRVVAWDQRGHGRSGAGDPSEYVIRRLGHDLRAVIDAQAALGPLVLVGHSMGGMTLMSLGAQHPDLVRDRVLAAAFVATSAGGTGDLQVQLGDAAGRFAQRFGPRVLVPLGERPGVVAAARKGARELEDALTFRYSFASPVPRSLLRYTADMILSTPIDVMAAFLGPISLHDEHEGLAAFAGIETLVVNGAQDLLTPPRHSDEIVRVLPQAEHVLIEGAGHLVMLEHPDILSDQLLALVERAQRHDVHESGRGRTVTVGTRRPTTSELARRRVAKASSQASALAQEAGSRAARARRSSRSGSRPGGASGGGPRRRPDAMDGKTEGTETGR